MRLYRFRTKREAVNHGLRKLVGDLGDPMTTEEILEMQGIGWGDGLELSDLRDDAWRLP